jgi:hypothetical protein
MAQEPHAARTSLERLAQDTFNNVQLLRTKYLKKVNIIMDM